MHTLAQLAQMIMQEPKTAEFCGEILKFATAPFSYRYAMPLYATLPAAAALAITRLRSVAGHREEPAA